jgi:4-hydroxybenzoyl-CoA thioesterase
MLTNTRLIRVQWGDCDPAGIVFYPRYFEWFDASTILLFEKATGLTKIRMLEKYNGAGLALLEARAVFKVASQYGEDLTLETRVTEFRRSSFFVQHTVSKGDGTLALEGFETRLWTARDPGDKNRLRSAPLPPEIVAAFQTAE